VSAPLPSLSARAEVCGFVVLGRLGEGRSSEVLLGERRGAPGERRALKVLRPALSLQGAEERERFSREADVLRRLDHPHVVRLEGLELHEGRPVMILEALEGEPLSAVPFERRPAPWRVALRWVYEAALGAGAAHALGVVHRDLKPSNLLLTPQGVKVLDFGVAKLLDADGAFSTRQGVVVGSPAYMAPEVCLGEPAGPPADVYSLGLIFYHVVMGRHPLLAPQQPHPRAAEMMRLHLSAAPPLLSALALGAPRGLDEALERACAADPAARYPSGEALALALRPYLDAPSEAPQDAPPRALSAEGVSALLTLTLTREASGAGGAGRAGGAGGVGGAGGAGGARAERGARAAWAVWAGSFALGLLLAQLSPLSPPPAPRAPAPRGERAAPGALRWVRVPALRAHGLREALEGEVTAAQYAACAAAGACPPLAPHRAPYGDCAWGGAPPAPDLPLSCVTRAEAEAFGAWAGGRLPTPEEWAALLGGGPWPWGTALPSCARATLMEGLAPACGAALRAQPSCARPGGRSVEGLCDLVGNLWEWGAGERAGEAPVLGGAWSSPAAPLTAPPRGWRDPGAREANVGFRLVR